MTGPTRVARSGPGGGPVNTVTVQRLPLCFTISRYRDFDDYGWSPVHRSEDVGELGLGPERFHYRGDPDAVDPLRDGFVYVYRQNPSGEPRPWALWKVFTVSEGQYQQVDARGESVDYDATVGPSRPYARIEHVFPGPTAHLRHPLVIIDSDIRLSDDRLRGHAYSLDLDPRPRGRHIVVGRSRLQDAPSDPPAGAEVLEAYRSREDAPDLVTYDLRRRAFDGEPGIDIRRPHAFREAARRNERYRERVEAYRSWLDDEDRNKEAYIHQTIAAVLRQDPDREGGIDMSRFRQWKHGDRRDYRRHFFPVHFAAEDLVSWLEEPLFREWLLDFNRAADDDVQESGLAAYVAGIRDLALSDRGRDYLREQFEDDASFFNLATHIPAIRRDYTDPDAHSNFAVEVRKVSNVMFAGMHEFAGLIVGEDADPRFAERLATWADAKGVALSTARGRTSRTVGRALTYVDTDRLERWARNVGRFAQQTSGRSVITFFELVNFGIAVQGVANAARSDGDGRFANLFFSVVNAAGATADMAGSGLLERYTARVVAQAGFRASRIYFLAVFSGVVDFVVGIRSGVQEVRSGDYDTAVGWGVFGVGGALVAFGGYLMMTGGTITVGTLGIGSVGGGAVILAGFLVEAIGLCWVWLANDDELDEWLIQSRFGRRPRLTGDLDAEIEVINDLMCKFEVDADFVSDTHVTLIVRPRLFTPDSVLELTGVRSSAEMRVVEMFFGDGRGDIVTGVAGLGSWTIDGEGRRGRFVRDGDGRVTEIRVEVYGRQDIDAIRGHASLRIGPGGFIHGYERDFSIEAGLFDG